MGDIRKSDLAKYIKIVKTGSREEVKEAKRNIKHFWHNFYIPNRKEGREAFEQFLDEIKYFDDICDIDHQAYFISALKWAVWAIGDIYFETWVDFIFKCMEHPSGKIRQQTIHTADILIIGLDLPGRGYAEEGDVSDSVLRQAQMVDLVRFGLYAYSTEQLIRKHSKPIFRRYKYVGSLPTSKYKSLQKLMTEGILRSEFYDNAYQWFLLFFERRSREVYSGHYSSDLKLLLHLVNEEDYSVIDLLTAER